MLYFTSEKVEDECVGKNTYFTSDLNTTIKASSFPKSDDSLKTDWCQSLKGKECHMVPKSIVAKLEKMNLSKKL